MATPALSIRPAHPSDRYRLDRLLSAADHLHNHLDWQSAHEWLGAHPFYFAALGDKLIGALAAPPDPPEAAWIRLAAVVAGFSVEAVLDPLWAVVQSSLKESQATQLNCMVLETWIAPHLERWGFTWLNNVIVLRRERSAGPRPLSPAADNLSIRSARVADIEAMTVIDNAAFASPWQYSKTVIQHAMAQASFTTVAEIGGELVGYQISSGGREGGHLARLAVRPDLQGRGIGRALVIKMMEHFEQRGAARLTVNTQHDNAASIAVYRSLGFEITRERYEVWQQRLNP